MPLPANNNTNIISIVDELGKVACNRVTSISIQNSQCATLIGWRDRRRHEGATDRLRL